MRIPMFMLVAVILISGCGYVGADRQAPTPSVSSNPMTFDVTATETTQAASMRVGQRLEVVLHAGSGMNNWTQPRSSDESILAPTVNPAATAVRGVTLSAFLAKASGQVNISAYGSPTCPSGLACPMYVIVFSLKVTVTP